MFVWHAAHMFIFRTYTNIYIYIYGWCHVLGQIMSATQNVRNVREKYTIYRWAAQATCQLIWSRQPKKWWSCVSHKKWKVILGSFFCDKNMCVLVKIFIIRILLVDYWNLCHTQEHWLVIYCLFYLLKLSDNLINHLNGICPMKINL